MDIITVAQVDARKSATGYHIAANGYIVGAV
jgi:hypothetical protein